MKNTNKKSIARQRRHKKIRTTVRGTQEKPRLVVFKSNKYLSAQIIDDDKGVTVASATTCPKGATIQTTKELGKDLAQKAQSANIEEIVFDRGGFRYTGQIKSFADSAREAGLKF
jgi:large subunit ribosomal protein L18